jgi:MtN3 and saliva related transmembrane protein
MIEMKGTDLMAFFETVDFIGVVAGMLTTVAFVPQVLKVVRTKSTKDLSLGMFLLFAVGILLWFIYGLCIGSIPVILANGATLILTAIILLCKFKYG